MAICIYNEIWKPVNESGLFVMWCGVLGHCSVKVSKNLLNSHTYLVFVKPLCQPSGSGIVWTYKQEGIRWEDTYPKAKTSDCLEKGSLSSSVSGESCWMISGARWHSQPLGILSLSSLRLQNEKTWRWNLVRVYWSPVSRCQAIRDVKLLHFHYSTLLLQIATRR